MDGFPFPDGPALAALVSARFWILLHLPYSVSPAEMDGLGVKQTANLRLRVGHGNVNVSLRIEWTIEDEMIRKS